MVGFFFLSFFLFSSNQLDRLPPFKKKKTSSRVVEIMGGKPSRSMMVHSKDEDDLGSAAAAAAAAALRILRVEHEQSITEMTTRFKAQLYDAHCETSDLRSELKETRARLGEAVVSSTNKQVKWVFFFFLWWKTLSDFQPSYWVVLVTFFLFFSSESYIWTKCGYWSFRNYTEEGRPYSNLCSIS